MSVIQKIQEKYAKLMAVIIAIALITFVVMLAFEGGGNLFQGSSSMTVGKVNGEKIEYNDFLKKVDQQEQSIEAQYAQFGGALPPGLHQQAIDNAWNQEVNQVLQNSELEKLGMQLGKKERGDILYGSNPPEDIKKAFTDEKTGFYNAQLAKQQIDAAIRKKKGTEQELAQRDQLIAYINYLENMRLTEKYNSLLGNSTNFPKWFIEKQNADNSQLAKISLVRESYASIPDSAIKITDKEIQDYIDEHKDDYPQEESRSIAYVTFSALPTAADSAAVRNQVLALKPEFDTIKNVATFLSRNGTAMPYSDVYVGKSVMQMQYKDTIQSLPINAVFGPYLDGGTYALAKMLDIKTLPDSVKCRHILLGTVDRSGQPIMEDSLAHFKADSIALAIKNGANFDSLETKYTTDQAAHADKGMMTFSSTQIQGEGFAKEFAQFILFDGKPGDKKVVKTQFGWHYIEILNFIKPEPHYKVAYMAKNIEASPETESAANNDASLFAGDSRDQKSFDANVEKLKAKGFIKNIAVDIKPTAEEIQGLGSSRSFVKNVYKAKLGEVVFDPSDKVGDNYVVAIVTEINEEGTQPIAKARPRVEPLLRNEKKAEQLRQKAGNVTTLEAAASALGGKQIETVDSLRMSGSQSSIVSSEPKVIGAAFNTASRGKVVPQVIEGTSGIYVVRVDNVSATSVAEANVAEQRKSRYQQAKQQAAYRSPIQALRESATIKDRRREFF